MGSYKIHVYAETRNDEMNYITDAKVHIDGMSAGVFYDIEEEYSRKLVLEDVEDQGIASKVQFAVWSDKNGQDDLCW